MQQNCLEEPTTWRRVLLKKLIATQLSRNFMKPQDSLPCPQEIAIGYEPDESNPQLSTLFP
jgi:hypothetical protein